MHHSKAGWLCMNCGHVAQGDKPKPAGVPVSSPPPPVASSVAPVIDHQEPPKSKRGLPKLAIIIAVVVLLLAGAAAFAYQAVVLGPKQAPGKYMQKVAEANSAVFNGTIKFTSEDQQYSQFKLTSRLNGKYDIADPKKPKIQLAIDGALGDGNIKAELILLERMLYFKVDTFDLLAGLGLDLEKDWYKYELPEDTIKNDCAEPVEKATAKLAEKLPLKEPKLVKLFDKVDGRSANHYRGSLDLAKLPGVIEEINKELSADCKMDIGEDDVKNLTIDYDLWSSGNFDRLVLVIKDSKSKSNIEITMDTSDYNKAVDVKAPEGAKEFGDLTGSSEERGRDTERKSEINMVRSALEQYYNEKNYYPSGDFAGLKTSLVSTYLKELPTDPSAVAYVYAPTGCSARTKRCTGYELRATLESQSDPDYPTYTKSSLNAEPVSSREPAGTALLPQLRAFIPFWK